MTRPCRFLIPMLALLPLPGCPQNSGSRPSASGTANRSAGNRPTTRETGEEATIHGRRFWLRAIHDNGWSLQIQGDGVNMSVGNGTSGSRRIEGATIVFGEQRLEITERPGEYVINGKPVHLQPGNLHYMLGPRGVESAAVY